MFTQLYFADTRIGDLNVESCNGFVWSESDDELEKHTLSHVLSYVVPQEFDRDEEQQAQRNHEHDQSHQDGGRAPAGRWGCDRWGCGKWVLAGAADSFLIIKPSINKKGGEQRRGGREGSTCELVRVYLYQVHVSVDMRERVEWVSSA